MGLLSAVATQIDRDKVIIFEKMIIFLLIMDITEFVLDD